LVLRKVYVLKFFLFHVFQLYHVTVVCRYLKRLKTYVGERPVLSTCKNIKFIC